MLNQTVLTGRLVGNPELRSTKTDGVNVASFRVAVRRDFIKDGEADTDFFDVVAWRGTADFICKYFKQSSLIQLSGRLQNRHWKDKHEQNRVSTELIADKAYFCEGKDKDGDNGGQQETLPEGFDPFA